MSGRAILGPYPAATWDEIIERLSNGASLRAILKSKDMPSRTMVMKKILSDAEYSDRYDRAREMQADSFADELMEIADDQSEEPASRRVRFDARRWYASKVFPRRYAEKVQNEHSGKDGGVLQLIITSDDAGVL
jgi:hypothetical protein